MIDIDGEFIYFEKQKKSDLYARYLQVLKDRNIEQSTPVYDKYAEWRSLPNPELGGGARKVVKSRSARKLSKSSRKLSKTKSKKSKSKKYSPSMLKWKKYTSRKSPGLPANHHCGEVRRGNDGNLWESKMNKNGICAWKSFK